MSLLENELYREDLAYVAKLKVPWEKLNGKSILLSGATGMIGSFFIDAIMYKNSYDDLNCHVYAMGRNEEKARKRFGVYWNDSLFDFVEHDVNKTMECLEIEHIDFVLHLASNTHPIQRYTAMIYLTH